VASRGRVEPLPEPPSRAPAGIDRNGAQRGRIEPPPEQPPRPAAGTDRNGNGAQRGRIDTPLEPPLARPGGSDWNAPSRGQFEAPPVAPAGQDAGKAEGDGSGGWLSNLLTRASREGDEPALNDDRGAVKSARPPKERAPSDDDRTLRIGIESVDSLSVDIDRLIDPEVAADLWERNNRGERNVSLRRLYTPQGRKAFEEMRKRYKADREFRQTVDRYIGQFDRILGDAGRGDGGPMRARSYITSEAGKIYTLLAHAAGRFE
jgi:hypothetical protein